ncbi:MAG TPA: universal stress protein [Candidatus Margulisiibacteriota bacterium]|nr:universal stress protein [Candidatus Margulisiibacteriota bacterium]
MHNVLLVIPASKEPQRAGAAAIELARQRGGKLVALVVVDPNVPSYAASTLSDVGFMGEQVSEQVSETIVREQHTRAAALLHALAERAKKEGVVVTPIVEEGDIGDICRRVIRTHAIGSAVLVAEKQSWLTRFLSRSAAVQLPALSGCEVRVMEED